MDNLPAENLPKPKLSQISLEEVDIINDIRELDFGKITIAIQDGVVVSKEITKTVRVRRNSGRNSNGNKQGYSY